MSFDPNKHHRRSIRLKNYDYTTPGAYFITICTHNRACLSGEVVNGKMVLNEFGKVVERCWMEIPEHFPHTELDAFVVMPNHVHGIIFIKNDAANDVANDAKNDMTNNIVAGTRHTVVGAKNFSPLRRRQQQRDFSSSRHDVSTQHDFSTQDVLTPHNETIHNFRSPSRTIGSIVRGFKIGVTKWFRQNTDIYTVWQRNYYEHIVRNEKELNRIRKYIHNNPLNWKNDENYKQNPR